jgi:hypothetical protein
MPRALRWAAVIAVLVAGFMLWDNTVRPLNDSVARRADGLARDVSIAQTKQSWSARMRRMPQIITSVGPVDVPGEADAGAEALTRTVNRLLQEYAVSDDSLSVRPDRNLPRDVLTQLGGGRQRFATVKGDLIFDASPQDTIAIIADLEASPEIECIRNLRITKSGNRKLKVRLGLESWVRASSRRGIS